jgi:hypothetical protein
LAQREAPSDECEHPVCRTYVFHCDGWRYLAIECQTCPVSTSMPISLAAVEAFGLASPRPPSRSADAAT